MKTKLLDKIRMKCKNYSVNSDTKLSINICRHSSKNKKFCRYNRIHAGSCRMAINFTLFTNWEMKHIKQNNSSTHFKIQRCNLLERRDRFWENSHILFPNMGSHKLKNEILWASKRGKKKWDTTSELVDLLSNCSTQKVLLSSKS